MRIKKFFEMFEDKFDYDRIITILKKNYGWGLGVVTNIDEFENNSEYFQNPQSDDEYIEQFHVYLSDKQADRLRGKLNNTPSLRLGKWKLGIQADKPTSIYNRLY